MSDELNPYPGNLKQHKVEPLIPDDPYLTELRKVLEPMEVGMDTAKQFLLLAGERDALLAARAKDAEEIAKWKGIVKGVHGALNDIGTVPVPPMDADLYDVVMAIRAKDAELIQTLVDALQYLGDIGVWYPEQAEALNAAEAAGFKPTNP